MANERAVVRIEVRVIAKPCVEVRLGRVGQCVSDPEDLTVWLNLRAALGVVEAEADDPEAATAEPFVQVHQGWRRHATWGTPSGPEVDQHNVTAQRPQR